MADLDDVGCVVHVRFTKTPAIWKNVVEESKELVIVESEYNDCFIAEYASETEWKNAIARFDPGVTYRKF